MKVRVSKRPGGPEGRADFNTVADIPAVTTQHTLTTTKPLFLENCFSAKARSMQHASGPCSRRACQHEIAPRAGNSVLACVWTPAHGYACLGLGAGSTCVGLGCSIQAREYERWGGGWGQRVWMGGRWVGGSGRRLLFRKTNYYRHRSLENTFLKK